MREFRDPLPENQKEKSPAQQVVQAVVARLEQLCPGNWTKDQPFHFALRDASLHGKFQSVSGVMESGVAIIKNEKEIRIREQGNVSGENDFVLIKNKGEWQLLNHDKWYELTKLLGLLTMVIKATEQKQIE